MNFDKKKYPILFLTNNPIELRCLTKDNLVILCDELRQFLIDNISKSGGHFASGLGTIELTVALHYIYNTPFDKLIWDIGHQAYPHKILTGRRDRINTIRKRNGLHSFPWYNESEYDHLSVGHSSTSISAGLGMAVAAEYEGLNRCIVCIIGDGAITAGMAFEAINHAGDIKFDLLVILNDNRMSISKNVGALNNYLEKILFNKKYLNFSKNNKKIVSITKPIKKYIKYDKENVKNVIESPNLFEELGFSYVGPIDGHNIKDLVQILKEIRIQKGPKLLHVVTKKGKGYELAEKDPISWHAISKFDLKIGILPKKNNEKKYPSYSSIFGNWLCSTAKNDNKLIAITPAMCEGSGMVEFSQQYPKQYFDVAIAEQHAVTFAAGLAISGYNPVVAIYSTFLQRAYDQVIHDVAIQNLPVLFAIDRGGIVGHDGKTHQGAFDLSYLRCVPNIVIMTPSDENECRLMLHTGYNYYSGPSVVRYPRGNGIGAVFSNLYKLQIGKGIVRYKGFNIAILNFGTLLPQADYAAKILNATLVDMRFVKPLDNLLIKELAANHKLLVTIEENSIIGGAGSGVNEYIMNQRLQVSVLNIGLPDYFIPQGSQEEIRSDLGLDGNGICKKIKNWIKI